MRSRPPGRLPPFVPRATFVQRLPAAPPVHLLVSVGRSHLLLRPPLASPRRSGCSVGGSLVAAAPDTSPVTPPAPPGGVGPLGGLRAVRRPRARSVAVGTRRPPRPVLLSSRRRARSAGVSSTAVAPSARRRAQTATPEPRGSSSAVGTPARVRPCAREEASASSAAPWPAASCALGRRFVRRRGLRCPSACPDGSPRTLRGFSAARPMVAARRSTLTTPQPRRTPALQGNEVNKRSVNWWRC